MEVNLVSSTIGGSDSFDNDTVGLVLSKSSAVVSENGVW